MRFYNKNCNKFFGGMDMKIYKVAVIGGDGICPEVIAGGRPFDRHYRADPCKKSPHPDLGSTAKTWQVGDEVVSKLKEG